jgi:hypothetical protein
MKKISKGGYFPPPPYKFFRKGVTLLPGMRQYESVREVKAGVPQGLRHSVTLFSWKRRAVLMIGHDSSLGRYRCEIVRRQGVYFIRLRELFDWIQPLC